LMQYKVTLTQDKYPPVYKVITVNITNIYVFNSNEQYNKFFTGLLSRKSSDQTQDGRQS